MPRVRTRLFHVTELDQLLYADLYDMNMREEGSMQSRFQDCFDVSSGWAVCHYDNTGNVDGWALLFQDYDYEYVPDPSTWVAYFYVPEQNRRKGIATALMHHARIVAPAPFVVPWSDDSSGFFKTCSAIRVSKHRIDSYGLDREKAEGI